MNQEQQVTVRIQKVKKNRIRMKLIVFAGLAAALLLITIFAKYICPYDPYAQDLAQAMQPPGAAHLMGTDTYGRDMLSRVLIGAQTSISSTFALVAIITVFGTVVGIFCGYYGGIVDSIMMRISDVCICYGSCGYPGRRSQKCGHRTCFDQLAQIFQNCKRTDIIHKKSVLYAGFPVGWRFSFTNDFPTCTSEYRRTDPGYFYAGYWYHDDGDCRIIVSGVGSPASGGRVGKYDEQRQEHATDLSMDRTISGIGHLCISCDI